jgi:hypothetical protein
MLTTWFVSLGLTRDSAVWFWGRLVSGATLFLGYVVLDPMTVGQYLTATEVKAVTLLAVVVLWLAGKYDSSPLKGK